jgi:hypothetical protein
MKVSFMCLMMGLGWVMSPLSAMESKSKPALEVSKPKVLPESTRASAPVADVIPVSTPSSNNTPVKLIDNSKEDNQKVHDGLPAAGTEAAPKAEPKSKVSKKTKKSSKKKVSKAKKTSGKKQKKKTKQK